MIKLKKLNHCGIMPNYECSAACRHCLYACSMTRTGGYMTREAMDHVCQTLVQGGCRSVHIGGGEPFLDFTGLIKLLKTAARHGISVDYIETNAYWAQDENDVKAKLHDLADAGADTFCISVDPFHAEYVPYGAPLRLAELCRKYGFGYFLWQERFLSMMRGVDAHKVHDRTALTAAISQDYIHDTAQAYGINMGGRAVNIAKEYYPRRPVGEVISTRPCTGLLSTDHFHVDIYGRFIPPGCTGYAIPLEEMLQGFQAEKYPAFAASLTGGVGALLEYATARGFTADPKGYTSNCGLCFHIRHWLSGQEGCPELDAEHFEESLLYY